MFALCFQLLSFSVPGFTGVAYAYSPNYTSETAFNAGDRITVSMLLNLEAAAAGEGYPDIASCVVDYVSNVYIAYAFAYKTGALDLVSYNWGNMAKSIKTDAAYFDYRNNQAYADQINRDALVVWLWCDIYKLEDGELLTAEFDALTDGTIDDVKFRIGNAINNEAVLNISIEPGGASTPSPYTVSPAASDESVAVSSVFNVDVKLSALPTVDTWGALQAYLLYNADLVAPGELPIAAVNGIIVSQAGAGRLLISRLTSQSTVDADGVTVVQIPFTASAAGDAEFTVADPKVSLTGETAMTDAKAGDPLTVEITGESPVAVTFDEDFAGAPAGFKLLQYALDAAPAVEYAYDGETMHYARIGGSHYVTYIVAADVTAEEAEALVEETQVPVTANDGDINGDATLEIVDAQIAYDLANGVFDADTGFTALTVSQRLKADFNADGIIDLSDAYAIQYKLHGLAQPY
jgi:hypothetical protein